ARIRAVRIGNAEGLEVRNAGGRKLARIDRGILSWPISFHVARDVGRGRIELPAQSVVQSDVRLDFPTVLRKRIKRSAANVFALTRTLRVGVHQPEQKLRVIVTVSGNDRIRSAVSERKFAVDVEIVVLVEAGAANIGPKLESVISFDPSQVIGPLKSISDLRQKSFEVISDSGAAANVDKGHSRQIGRQAGGNPQLRTCAIGTGNCGGI